MFDKEFYEKYACASLKFFYEDLQENFFLADCPDIQNDKDSIGIEVTRGISEYSGKYSRLFQDCIEKNLNLEERYSRANRMFRNNFLGIMHEYNSFVINNPQYENDYYELHIRKIIEKIKIKIEKLEKIYKKFDWNCLYIFAEYPFKSNHIWVLSDLMCAENLTQYDIYFINALDRIYVINARDNFNFKKRKYTAAELCDFTKEAQKEN